MKATLETINGVSQAVDVEVPADLVANSRKTALAEIAKEIKVPGFRKGKVPADVVANRLGKEADQEIIKQIVKDTYPQAVAQVEGKPISDPRIEAKTLEDGKDFSYRAIFEIYPEVKAEKYAGLKLESEKVAVESEEVERELSLLQQRMTQLEPAPDAELGSGTMALIDFNGTADKKSFEGSEAKDFVVDYGTGSLLKEFEEQIAGMKTNEEKDISFVYPADFFNKDIAGKQGEFHVKVKEVRKKNIPALDDELAKSLGDFKTLADLKTDLTKRIQEAKEELQRRKLHRQIIEQLAKQQEIEVPEVMVNAELNSMLEQLNHDLQQRGQTLEQAGVDAKGFVSQNLEEAKLRTRGFLLVNSIAKQEEIAVAKDEVEARLAQISAQANHPIDKVKEHYEQNNLMAQLEGEILLEKSLDLVVKKSKIKTIKAKSSEKA